MRVPIIASTPQQRSKTTYIGGKPGDKYRFTVITQGLIRYEWAPDGDFEDRPSSFAQHRPSVDWAQLRYNETATSINLYTERFHLTYDKEEFSPSGLFAVIKGYTGTTWRFGEEHDTLGGTYRTLDGIDGRVAVGAGVASRNGFAVIDDSKSLLFTKDGFIAPRKPGPGRVDSYLFCYGHDYREAVKALYLLSGSQPLLPRWTLGNWWSRYYEYTAESYIELMDKFERNGIPLSVGVIDMDWHLVTDQRVKDENYSGWTGYTWNKKFFPDPKEFIRQCHERNLKMTLNEHPADGIHSYEDIYQTMAKAVNFNTDNRDPIPFDIANRTFNKAYFDVLLASLEKDGLDFWWVDWQQGTNSSIPGVDPLWVLNHFHFLHNAKLQQERSPECGGGSRPIVFSRYAGPGSQRYPIGFSGDTVTTWASLNFQPEFTATASNIGYGWWSHDIGGHMQGIMDDELTARWVQLGVFSPIMRLHSTKNRWVRKEPWNLLGSADYGPQSVVTDFLRLRHRLIPYLHTMNARAAEKGEPLVQPLYWDYPAWEESYTVPNQYLFGSQMMVAPITSPQSRATLCGKVRAWLPPGTWIDFFTGMVYDGGRFMWLCRTLDQIPVLVKPGAIIPLDGKPVAKNGAGNADAFEITVVVGADGCFEILEEDENHSGTDGSWMMTRIKYDDKVARLSVGATIGADVTERRTWSIRFLGLQMPEPENILMTANGVSSTPSVEVTDAAIIIHLGTTSKQTGFTLTLPKDPKLKVNKPEDRIFDILYKAQVPIPLKEELDRILTPKNIATSVRVSQLEALNLDEDLRLVLVERLLADQRSFY